MGMDGTYGTDLNNKLGYQTTTLEHPKKIPYTQYTLSSQMGKLKKMTCKKHGPGSPPSPHVTIWSSPEQHRAKALAVDDTRAFR